MYVHIVNARAQARAHFLRSQLSVHVWRWSCVCEWEETIKDNWRINVVLMLIALVRRHSSSLKSCLLRWSYLKWNETLKHNRFVVSNFKCLSSVGRATQNMKWRNSFVYVYCRHQWLSLISKYVLIFWFYLKSSWCRVGGIRGRERGRKKEGVNLSNKLTPNYLTKKREQISVRTADCSHTNE